MNKICKKCNINKDLNDFFKRKPNFKSRSYFKDGHDYYCKLCRKADLNKWKEQNKEKIKKDAKIYGKIWRRKNRLKLNEYYRNRTKNDLQYRLKKSLRARIRQSLNRYSQTKTISGKRTTNLLGCSIDEFKIYIEKLFTKGMSWNNYGEWQIDHIKPCASFDLTDSEQQKECFHYNNLQPLWATTEIAIKYGENKNYIGNCEKKDKLI